MGDWLKVEVCGMLALNRFLSPYRWGRGSGPMCGARGVGRTPFVLLIPRLSSCAKAKDLLDPEIHLCWIRIFH